MFLSFLQKMTVRFVVIPELAANAKYKLPANVDPYVH